ncbi:MAG: hypothetical protein A2014_04730 [Spirochaetes bacterium GWF1_49_6]|nr:MAG: hypothetical protein A2014_04730 [Spirochaetes bacterium GWF1_49_6]
MSINENLKNLYQSKLNDLKTLVNNIGNEDTADYEGPLLMYCWEDKYLSSKKKILFIGQETNGWNGFLRPTSAKIIDDIIDIYKGFELGARYNSVFWQYVNYINKKINDSALNFMWTNVLKFGRSGIGRPDEQVQEEELLNFNILKDEIEILNPDVVLFFSGPNYDQDIINRIDGVEFNTCSNRDTRVFTRLKHKVLPSKTFRTYHPNYLRKSGNEDILDEIINLINE